MRQPTPAGYVNTVDISDPEAMRRAAANGMPTDVNVWFIHVGFFEQDILASFAGHHIVWAIFETDKPMRLVRYLQRWADVVWTPSKWASEVLQSHGIAADRIDVIPEGVDSKVFNPVPRQTQKSGTRPFRFLAVGKLETRKGYLELFRAFRLAFQGDPDVELVIKADYVYHPELARAGLEHYVRITGVSNIRVAEGLWPMTAMAALYAECDAFVLPTRGEGWGLSILEAVAVGLPVVTLMHSGPTEYLSAVRDSVLAVDYRMQVVDDPMFLHIWGPDPEQVGRWAIADLDSLVSRLREVREGIDHYAAAARTNATIAASQFSWDAAARSALQALQRRATTPRVRPSLPGLAAREPAPDA
jgi:glycosyltransferase involved in cell wall biosynthesis